MSPTIITIQACINSNLAAAAGALTGVVLVWLLLSCCRLSDFVLAFTLL